MLARISRLSLASTAIILIGAQSAFAIDADDFGAKLAAAGKLMGLSFQYETATAEGDTVTLSNFTLASPGEEDDIELPGDLVFEGVVEAGDGSYTAQTASVDDIVAEEDGTTVRFENIRAENLTIPASATLADAFEISASLYERISAGPLTVSIDGTEAFAVDLMEIWIEEVSGGGLGSGYEVSGIRGDLSSIEEPEAQEVIAALGMEEVSGSINGYGTWHPQDGTAEVEEMRFTLDNLASLNITFAVSGYTMEMYNELMKMNLKMAELAEADEELSDEQMEGLEAQMLEQFSDVKLDRAAIRYEDASLFNKVLELVAAEQGIESSVARIALKSMLPMVLIEVEAGAALTEMITNAVNAFVDDPQNLEVSAEPETPVGVEELMAAQDDPSALVETLNVQIRANQ